MNCPFVNKLVVVHVLLPLTSAAVQQTDHACLCGCETFISSVSAYIEQTCTGSNLAAVITAAEKPCLAVIYPTFPGVPPTAPRFLVGFDALSATSSNLVIFRPCACRTSLGYHGAFDGQSPFLWSWLSFFVIVRNSAWPFQKYVGVKSPSIPLN